jgi:hypothetical protein
LEAGEGAFGGAIDVSGVIGPYGLPILGEAIEVERFPGGDGFKESEGLIAVVGEIAGGATGVVFGRFFLRADEAGDAAEDALDFGGVIDPVGAEGVGVAEERAEEGGEAVIGGWHGSGRRQDFTEGNEGIQEGRHFFSSPVYPVFVVIGGGWTGRGELNGEDGIGNRLIF